MSKIPSKSKGMKDIRLVPYSDRSEAKSPQVDLSKRSTFLRMDVFLKHGFKVDRVTFKAFHIMKQTVDAPFGLFYTNDINSSPYVVKIYDFSHEQSLLKLASRYDIDETAMVPQNKGKINVKIVAKFKEYYDVSDEMVKFVNISPKYDMRNWYKDHMIELEKKKLPAQTDFEDRPTLVAPVEYDRIPPSTSRCYDGDDLRTPKRAKQTMKETETAVAMMD